MSADPPGPLDPFGTAAVRERVLAGWTAAPVRFREDANAEEDLVLGGYRDRLVVELAQNAADAAARAGVPGRLLLRAGELDGRSVLVAANTGAALDADGVQALATLRASAKREPVGGAYPGEVGRFGVGFAAVLAVSDSPALVSRHGGARFSSADTRALVEEHARAAPELAGELARRDGHVPVLRLPFPARGSVPAGYDTAVLLPLRDAVAEDLVGRLLDGVDDALLLALPGLEEVVVALPGAQPRTVTGAAGRWHVLCRTGSWDPALLAGRPTEERARTSWSLTWALPRAGTSVSAHVAGSAGAPRVLYAPTPSDEPMDWPALLIASFPMDPSRRHVAPGPATDALLDRAAEAYADLLQERAGAGAPVWPLVPVGLAAGALDAQLRERVLRILPDRPLLASAADPALMLRPRDAAVLEPPAGEDPGVVKALAAGSPGLVAAPRSVLAAAATLGVARPALAEVVELLPLVPDPGRWRHLYAVLSGPATDPAVREALAGLPVPLADGRVVRGPRGAVVPVGPPGLAGALGALGTRTVHPEAVHPLLERLGAQPVGPREALELPEVRAVVATGPEEPVFPTDPVRAGDPFLPGRSVPGEPGAPGDGPPAGPVETGPVEAGPVEAVLTLVGAAVADGRLQPGELEWLGGLWLADDAGESAPAEALALPGSVASRLFHPDDIALVSPDLVTRWGPEVLRAVGVVDGLSPAHLVEVPLGGGLPEELVAAIDPEDWRAWSDGVAEVVSAVVPGGVAAGELVAAELVVLRDLDAVRDGAWPEVLAQVAADPALRAAVTDPVRLWASPAPGPGGVAGVEVRSFTAWWLRRRLAGGRAWADPAAEPGLAVLLPPAPALLAGIDRGLRVALGAVTAVGDLDPAGVRTLLDRLAAGTSPVDAATLVQVWAALARLAAERPELAAARPPDRVRVLDGAGTRVVPAEEAVVVDGPDWLQRTDLGSAVIAAGPGPAAALAELFDLPLAGELADGRVDERPGATCVPSPVPGAVAALLPGAPRQWCEHERLYVDGVEVDWWVDGPPGARTVHASTFGGLADGLAWAGGAWHLRAALAEVLAEPGRLGGLLAEYAFDVPR